MTSKEIKAEARKKLALNMHQAIMIYTVEFAIFITLVALVVISCVCLGVNMIASIVMICYGVLLGLIAIVGMGMLGFAMTDFYLVTYRCRAYDIRRLGDTLARSNITKVLLVSLKRTLIAFLLLLCFIVPGIIYLVRTSMANHLLIANPKMTASASLSASNKVMSGKTGSYFALCMSLIGWYFLGIFTLGLGFIFIMPYINLVKAVYYKRNLQGDRNVYVYNPAQQAPAANGGMGGTVTQTQAPQTVDGPAPIDALADDDVMDMNAAIRDFGGDENIQNIDVPEVPIAPVGRGRRSKTTTVASEPVTPVAAQRIKTDERSHRIDGTGLVETERTLSAEEINASSASARQAIENMYSNTRSDKPVKNYFASTGTQSPDDFGTVDVTDTFDDVQPIVDPTFETPVVETPTIETQTVEAVNAAEPAEHIMSDGEFDDFLKMFDDEPAEEAPQSVVSDEPTVVVEPVADEPTPAQHAPSGNAADDRRAAAAQRRKEAEERIARDREASAARRAQIRENARAGHVSHDATERAERLRQERERRLNKTDK